MVNKEITFPVKDYKSFRNKMLNWVNRFSIFCLLDNQHYQAETTSFECLLAAGSIKNISAPAGDAFHSLQQFSAQNKGSWLFGHFGYDLKNETEEGLFSANEDRIGFPDLHFFVPETVIRLAATEATIFNSSNASGIFEAIVQCSGEIMDAVKTNVAVKSKIDKSAYISAIEKLQQHILRGDCYEINFCQEFFAENVSIDPLHIFDRLTQLSPNPFSALYKLNECWCLCASPERYLRKNGDRLISQPIKGTSKRDLTNTDADQAQKQYLLQSNKEKSENVMVVDLVRNDLSRICKPGSVQVDELFGLYSFPQVHQMISTISGEIEADLNWIDAIKATFPMGSMTGAPKKKVMELLEEFEQSKRGLFSGAIGYVAPNEDFDFNVVIRSMFLNTNRHCISFQTGSGITFYSDAEKEYEECMLKAEAMQKVLE